MGLLPRLVFSRRALEKNYKRLAELSWPAECGSVVKANAYGLGVDWVVPCLSSAGCSTFFVSHPEEGVEVRKLAPQAVIFVFHGLSGHKKELFLNYNLRPCANSIKEFQYCRQVNLLPALHVDTGMNRLGIKKTQAVSNLNDASLIMTHLACSDEPENCMNYDQEQAFLEWVSKNNARKLKKSVLNSGGIFCRRLARFDLTRPGISLYGCSSGMGQGNQMTPVFFWEAPILAINEVRPGESVGYGATYDVNDNRLLATVATGYADGYSRSLSGKGWMLLNDVKCPVIGRVSMDLTTIDVTEALASSNNPIQTGAMVKVVGSKLSIDILANIAGTINYELLTGLGQRFEKIVE